MATVERIETWHGVDVLDGGGEKAGRLEEVYYDSTAQEPVLLLVKRGMLGHQVMLVPAFEAAVCHDYLRVPFTAEQINRAQGAPVDEELSSEQAAAIGALFKVTLPSSGPLYSASLIERPRVEAQKAQRQAHELEAEAHHRTEELEEAQKRADAAAEEALAAQRARERADAAAFEADRQTPPS